MTGAAEDPGSSSEPRVLPMPLADLDDEPWVSVLITNYNYGRFIGDALQSVLRQSYDRCEIIVCDDGSTDDSCAVVESFVKLDDRVHLVAKSNGGQASAFNAAFGASKGEIICFLDADDLFLTHKVEKVVRALRGARSGLLVHQLMIIDEEGRELQRIPTFTDFEEGWLGDRVVRRGGRWRWMPTSGVAIRREVADLIFPVPEEPFRIDADMFMLELAPLLTNVAAIPQILGHYRLHGANAYSRRGIDKMSVSRTIRSITTALEQVNQKLSELELEHVRLDPSRNLKLQEQSFLLSALDGRTSRLELIRSYRVLARAITSDDLYSSLQRTWASVLYLGIVALPVGARERWASASLGIPHAKELLRRMQSPVRRSRRLPSVRRPLP